MHFQILTPARSKQQFLLEGETEYLKRIGRYAKIEIIELNQKIKSKKPDDIKLAEGQAMLERARRGAIRIALDETGKSLTSAEFATLLDGQFQNSSCMSFFIGGPYGISEAVRREATHCISLSPLTFTAQFARLILTEQLYRAISILNGMPYHKD